MLRPYWTEFRRLAENAFAAYGVMILWVMTVILEISVLAGQPAFVGGMEPLSVSLQWMLAIPGVRSALMARPGVLIFMGLVFAPLVEEAVFRMLPLALVEKWSKTQIHAVVIVVCGIVFGYAHGSPLNIFIQGFVGMMLGFLYLKNGPRQLSSYFSCVAVHASYNFTMLAISVAIGSHLH